MQHVDYQSGLNIHDRHTVVPKDYPDHTKKDDVKQKTGVSIFSRHKEFDVDDPRNVTGVQMMESMKMTMQSTGKKFRQTHQTNNSSQRTHEKDIRYKAGVKDLPSDHPNHDYNWLSNKEDYNRIQNGNKITPVFDKGGSRYDKSREKMVDLDI